MKKKIVIILTILILIVVAPLIHRLYFINTYKSEYKTIDTEIAETWNINHRELDQKDYFALGDIKIENEFEGFKALSDTDVYVLKDEENRTSTAISYIKAPLLINTDKPYSDSYYDAKNDAIEEFLKKHNFQSDSEFIKYLIESKEEKVNIFSSTKKIKENYATNFSRNNILVPGKFHLLEGSYKGYVTEEENKYEVNILDDNEKHIITFVNKNYFTEEKIKDLIGTIKMD